MSNLVRMLHACVVVFSNNGKHSVIMNNFKFSFLSRGQLESLNLDNIFLPLLKYYHAMIFFLVIQFLPSFLECCPEIIWIVINWCDNFSERQSLRFTLERILLCDMMLTDPCSLGPIRAVGWQDLLGSAKSLDRFWIQQILNLLIVYTQLKTPLNGMGL